MTRGNAGRGHEAKGVQLRWAPVWFSWQNEDMVTVLVDGYNVIHAIPPLARQMDRSLDAARAALVALCQGYRTRRGDVERLVVVFDGRGADDAWGRQEREGVTVLFARRPEEADDRILSLIRAGGRSRFVVVSNDTVVSNNARALGAQVIRVAEFAGRQTPSRGPRTARPAADHKIPLSTSESDRITADYLKHLEQQRKDAR